MCIRCVIKVASTFEIYATYCHIDKISKINKISFGVSTFTFSCYALGIFFIYILSELSRGCCMPLCSWLQHILC